MRLYNKFLERLVLPVGDLLNGSSYMQQLNQWRKMSLGDSLELNHLQQNRLNELLIYSFKNIPYYQNIFNSQLHKNKYSIQDFPVITKEILNNASNQLILPSARNLIRFSSSGSSGIQSTVYMNKTELSSCRAIQTLWWNWAGFELGAPFLQTGMNTKRSFEKKVKDVLTRTLYINAFSGNKVEYLKILRKLNRKYQWVFGGYASSLNVFAETALENNIDDLYFKGIISWGDKLFDQYRKNLQAAFHAPVYETYGSSEGFLIAAQYDLDYMYIMSPHVYLELLDDHDQPVKDGEMGHVVVTRLDARSMPLIRYKLGDLAIKLPLEEYPQNRKLHFPLLKKVIGRDTDVVKTKSGKVLVVHSFTGIFEYYPEIRQFRIIQDFPEAIQIEYIPRVSAIQGVLDKIKEDIYSKTGTRDELEITFRQVKEIPPTKSGKPQIILSRLGKVSEN